MANLLGCTCVKKSKLREREQLRYLYSHLMGPTFYLLQRMGQGAGIKEKSQTHSCPSAMLFLEIYVLWNLIIFRGKDLIFKFILGKILSQVLLMTYVNVCSILKSYLPV